jgi:hypothetical protein
MTDTHKPVEDLLTDYDIFDPEFVKNPYPGYSEIRESQCPIAHTDRYQGSWLPTRYEDVVAIAQEFETFTSRQILVMPPVEVKARMRVSRRRRSQVIHLIIIGIVD